MFKWLNIKYVFIDLSFLLSVLEDNLEVKQMVETYFINMYVDGMF